MKSLIKLSLLFALIIAGRYMQLTTPADVAGLTKSPVVLFTPTTMTLAHYMESQPVPVVPVSQQKQVAATWY